MDAMDDAARRASQRVMWVLAPLFFIVGLVAGCLLVMEVLSRTGVPGQTAADSGATAANTVKVNDPPQTPSGVLPDANNAPEPPPANAPSGDKPTEPAPVPPASGLFQVLAGEAARVRLKGEGGFRTPERGLAEGDTLRVERGEARIESAAVFAVLSDRGELEVVADNALRLVRGRLVIRVLQPECVITFNESRIVAAMGEYVIAVFSGLGQLEAVCGRASVALGDTRAVADAGYMAMLSGELQVLPLEQATLAALRTEVDAGISTLMRWDFETGSGTCDLGRVVEGGASGAYSLRWDPIQTGAGTSLWPALFKAAPASRLRLWVLTEASSIEVTARMHLPEGVRGVAAKLAVPLGEGWRMIDVPLDVLRGGARRDQPGFAAGAEYSGLQFSVPPSRDELLVSRPLAIDDVTVYAIAR